MPANAVRISGRNTYVGLDGGRKKIGLGCIQDGWTVAKHAQADIAVTAQQATNPVRYVVMVDMKTIASTFTLIRNLTTNGTAKLLLFCHRMVLVESNSVSAKPFSKHSPLSLVGVRMTFRSVPL